MRRSRSLLLLASVALTCAVCAAPASEPGVHPGANQRFLDRELDVERWIGVFEGESREIATRRQAILEALALEPGATVADIGAGTGLFIGPFAQAVGPEGRVYAVDVSPRFLEHLRARVAKEGLTRVQVVEGKARSAELPEASVDLAFVCDTYHHFEYPESMLASLRGALRPGGALVVIDFERIPGKSPAWILEHMRADKATFTDEIEAAGFVLERELGVEGLVENYVLRFRRP